MELGLSLIHVGDRRREDMGDIDALASSIDRYGLLHPVVVDSDNRLVAGGRRLAAVTQLGWLSVPVRQLDTGSLKIVPADKAREADLIEWDALRQAKLDEFIAKREQERPFLAEVIGRMRAHGGDTTMLEACPDLFGHSSEKA